MKATISQNDLETWADFLLNHSLGGVQPGDVIMVKGEHITWPLMAVLQDKIFTAGAIADINLVAPDNNRGQVFGASIARRGTLKQIEMVPPWHRQRYEAMNKYIEILGAEQPELFAGLPEETSAALARMDHTYKEIRMGKSWVLTLFPTEAFADIEGMSLEEYTGIIVSASTTDPGILEDLEAPIHELIEQSRVIRIQTVHPSTGDTLELRMGIADQTAVKCTGKRNFPDGEVFTSPDARTVEGEIFIDLPVYYNGVTLQGIYLKLEDGVIREYSAEREGDTLKKIIETDPGSHRIGEVALGMNRGLTVPLKHPLFVEKVSGTLHIAIGASYPECFVPDPNSAEGKTEIARLTDEGAFNKSAQHVDIVVDFREGGAGKAVFLDDTRLKIRDNTWVLP